MKTTKAYLAGLGTTGILIGSVLLVMFLGSGAAAFSGHPGSGATDPLDRVVVKDDALATGAREARGADAARRAGVRAGRDALDERRAPAGLPDAGPAAGGGSVRDRGDGSRGDRSVPQGGGSGSREAPWRGGGSAGGGGGQPGGGGGWPGGDVALPPAVQDRVLPPASTAPPALPRAPSIDNAGPRSARPPTSRAAPVPGAGRGG